VLVIGIGHRKGVGKDEFAKALAEELAKEARVPADRVAVLSLSALIKHTAFWLLGWAGVGPPEFYNGEGYEKRETPLGELGGLSPRDVWVSLAQLVTQMHPQALIRASAQTLLGEEVYVIFPNIRSMEEIEWIKGHDYHFLIKIERGKSPAAKELDPRDRLLTEYDGWNSVIENDGDIEELKEKARKLAGYIVSVQRGAVGIG